MSTLFEDIRLARPTRFMFVPRVSAMIHQHYQAELVRRTAGVSEYLRDMVAARLIEEPGGRFKGVA